MNNWVVDKRTLSIVTEEGDKVLVWFLCDPPGVPLKEAYKNLQLMAKAPEMYDTLKNLNLEQLTGYSRIGVPKIISEIEKEHV